MKHILQFNKFLKGIVLFTLALIFGISPAYSQTNQYTFSGTVTDQTSGEPVIGGAVYILKGQAGGVTDVDGNYKFSASLSPGTYTLVSSYVGLSTERRSLTVGDAATIDTDFTLKGDIMGLDEVVVTGNVVDVNKRQLGNAIATVQAYDLQNNGATAVDQALQGKVAGALVTQNSGDPAGGISVRMRGASTIAGSSEPLYIVDGIFINNTSNQLIDLGGNSQNRLADINPNDIERIEIIRGAAAAAIYGSRASNGVVQIFTKRGKAGKPKYSFSSSVRFNSLRKKIDVNTAPLAWEVPSNRTNLNTVPATRYDFQDEIFQTGLGLESNLSVSGGSENTQYFISGSYLNNEGIVKSTDFKRYALKINLNQKANEWLNFNTGLNFIRSGSQDMPNGGINAQYGAITGFLFSTNAINPAPNESGVYPVTSQIVPRTNPAEAVARFDFNNVTHRVIANLGATAQITKNLTANYILGVDYYNQSGTAFIPRGNTSTQPDGFARRADANVFQYNNDLNFSYNFNITPDIISTSVIGGTWQYEQRESIIISATNLPPIVEIAQSGAILNQAEARTKISFWGGFIQQTFGFKDKLFINGALRMDGASVFGEDERNQLYGKASASYILSSEDFWESTFGNAINTFKLRASWGQAGNLTALGFFDRLSLYAPIAINSQNGLVPLLNQGNEGLAPERQEEIEVGFETGFLDNRLGLEFSYYHQRVTDLLLQRELAPSTGFGTRFENVGNLENTGIELLLRAYPIRTSDLNWSITTTFASNKNRVTNVAGEQLTLPGSFSTNFVIEGQPLGVFRNTFYARDDDGNILLNATGYPFAGTNEDGTRAKVIGDPNPDWFGSFINEVDYKNFSFRIQFDAIQGFDVFNWNRRLLDNVLFGGGPNVGEELLGNRPKGTGGAQAGIFEEFVEDGSFVKLREISVGYTFKPKNSAIEDVRFSVVGRNLFSWDDYSGWDPEINTAGQSNGVRGFDFAAVPIPRTIQFGINLSF